MATNILILNGDEYEINDDDFAKELAMKNALLASDAAGDLLTAEQIAQQNAGVEDEDEEGEDEVEDETDDEDVTRYYILNKDYSFTFEDIVGLIENT